MTLACTFTFAIPDDFDFTKHVNFAWFLSGLVECGASFYPNWLVFYSKTGIFLFSYTYEIEEIRS